MNSIEKAIDERLNNIDSRINELYGSDICCECIIRIDTKNGQGPFGIYYGGEFVDSLESIYRRFEIPYDKED